MTNEELITKIRKGEDVEENTEKLYISNKGLIHKIASHYSSYEDIEDLMQEGYIGLETALELWDPEGGASFATYAYHWIRQAIRRYIDNYGTSIKLSVHRKERIYKYQKTIEEFQQAFMRNPTNKELALYMGVSPSEIDKIRADALCLNPRSTSESIDEEGTLVLEDTISDDNDRIEDVLDQIERKQLSCILWGLVNELKNDETLILEKRYKDGLTFQGCGEALGITKDRARAIEQNALRKLRKPKYLKRLKPFITDQAISLAYGSTGVGVFNRTWTSATERAVMALEKK